MKLIGVWLKKTIKSAEGNHAVEKWFTLDRTSSLRHCYRNGSRRRTDFLVAADSSKISSVPAPQIPLATSPRLLRFLSCTVKHLAMIDERTQSSLHSLTNFSRFTLPPPLKLHKDVRVSTIPWPRGVSEGFLSGPVTRNDHRNGSERDALIDAPR